MQAAPKTQPKQHHEHFTTWKYSFNYNVTAHEGHCYLPGPSKAFEYLTTRTYTRPATAPVPSLTFSSMDTASSLAEYPPTVLYIPNFISEDVAASVWKGVYEAPSRKWTVLANR